MKSRAQEYYEEFGNTCTCFLGAPCSFCTELSEEEVEVYIAEGIRGLQEYWLRASLDSESRQALKSLCLQHWEEQCGHKLQKTPDGSVLYISFGDMDINLDRDGDLEIEAGDGYHYPDVEAVILLLSEAGYVVLPKELFEDD